MKNNVNATNLWFISAKPTMSNVDGKLVLDFTLIDEWMKEAKRLGWQNIVYFLGGNPYGFPRTMNMEQELFVLMQDEGDREARVEKFLKLAANESNRGKVLEEIRGVYAQWVKEVSEHAQTNDWPELIFTPFDEPAKARQKKIFSISKTMSNIFKRLSSVSKGLFLKSSSSLLANLNR